MKYFWLSALLLLPFSTTAAIAFVEGTHYKKLSQPQATVDANKIEVLELFWYGCPHCHKFQVHVERWLKTKPANVNYVRMPAVLREDWGLHARAFYTAETLGVIDKIHMPLFEAIHNEKRYLFTEGKLMQFFKEHGISNDDFRNTFHSFAVDSKVRRARQMSRRYQVRGTPAVIINGKYMTGPGMAKGFVNMIKVIDHLVAKDSRAN